MICCFTSPRLSEHTNSGPFSSRFFACTHLRNLRTAVQIRNLKRFKRKAFMPHAISNSIRLYGTDETVEPPRILQAGPLTVEFEGGNLRHIRYHGHEMLRAISLVVRDKNWGTYVPEIVQLH